MHRLLWTGLIYLLLLGGCASDRTSEAFDQVAGYWTLDHHSYENEQGEVVERRFDYEVFFDNCYAERPDVGVCNLMQNLDGVIYLFTYRASMDDDRVQLQIFHSEEFYTIHKVPEGMLGRGSQGFAAEIEGDRLYIRQDQGWYDDNRDLRTALLWIFNRG